MPLRRALVVSTLFVAACADAPLPAPAAPRPSRAASAPVAKVRPIPAPAASSVVAAEPPPPPPVLAVPPPPAEPLPPITRGFAKLTLPGAKMSIVGVAGRSPTDIWFLDTAAAYIIHQGGVEHWNGTRIDRVIAPECQGTFLEIQLDRDGILLPGTDPGSGSWTSAYIPFKGKSWGCDYAFWGVAMGLSNGHFSEAGPAPGAAAWAFDCPSPFHGPCSFRSAGGRRAPFPEDLAALSSDKEVKNLRTRHWQIRGDDTGWMVLEDERQPEDGDEAHAALHRYNGVTWSVVSSLDALDISGMWVDQEGNPWLTANGALVRHDGKVTVRLPVPEAFAPTVITGTNARDVWFFGPAKQVYQWDGERLRGGEAPFDVGGAWAAPNGEVWITGRWDYDTGQSAAPVGVVARTAALPEVKQ